MPKPLNGNGRYMPGLDGLRALAVLFVILYHLNVNWAPGGLLGVGIFFVLSGYLITDILIAQWRKRGRLDLKEFYLRRARRLMPALLVMILAVVAWITLFDRGRLPSLLGEVVSALLYVNNWWHIVHEVSYFESFDPPSPFGHIWSLAVEEQFYLLWPILLALGLMLAPRRGRLVGLTLLLALVSALVMAFLYEPGTDPSRVYYGTDTRAFALLIGAALAIVWPSGKLSAGASRSAHLLLDGIGGASLLAVLAMIWLTDQYDSFLYRGGFVLLSIAVAALVAALAHPASRLGAALGWSPLRWLGVRSYGIYLWHYPVIVLTSPTVNTGSTSIPLALGQMALCIALAALSWRFIEEPIRQGALGPLWKQVRSREWRWDRVLLSRRIVSVCALLVLAMSCVGVAGWASGSTASSFPHGTGGINRWRIQSRMHSPTGRCHRQGSIPRTVPRNRAAAAPRIRLTRRSRPGARRNPSSPRCPGT
ncbi:acyltransferase family protein [Paenibacillus sp. NPDC056579]|uniref:acyltransferase family protein n=1 Tax=Paenibacillus sp. NPDC056579 TaxID=3345871 RepID=UPI0036CFE094